MSSNTSVNLTMEIGRVAPVINGLMRLQSALILLLNLFVLVCLITKKSKFSKTYWIQMSCLSFNDLIAGFSSLMMSFIDLPYFGTTMHGCSGTVAFFFTSQCATLYNIGSIGIHRFFVIRRLGQPVAAWSNRSIIIYTYSSTAVSWMVAALLCSLPFILWAVPQERFARTGFCSLTPLFEENFTSSMKIFVGSFLLPLMFTNLLFGTMFCMLHKPNDKTAPKGAQQPRPAATTTTEVSVTSTRNLEPIPIGPTYLTSGTSLVNGNSKESGMRPMTSHMKTSDSQKSGPPSTVQNTISKSDNRQRSALKLLGIILVLVNVFTWPAVIVLFMQSLIATWSLGREVVFPLFNTICLNSIFNPIVYTIRVKTFQTVLIDMFPKFRRRNAVSAVT